LWQRERVAIVAQRPILIYRAEDVKLQVELRGVKCGIFYIRNTCAEGDINLIILTFG